MISANARCGASDDFLERRARRQSGARHFRMRESVDAAILSFAIVVADACARPRRGRGAGDRGNKFENEQTKNDRKEATAPAMATDAASGGGG